MYFRCQIQNYMSINSNFYSLESKLKVWESLGLAHIYYVQKFTYCSLGTYFPYLFSNHPLLFFYYFFIFLLNHFISVAKSCQFALKSVLKIVN